MKRNNLQMAALALGITLSAQGQQAEHAGKAMDENIPELIISLEKQALASPGVMQFVELSDTDVIYFDPSLERKIEGIDQLRAHYENNMRDSAPADHFEMIRPVVQVADNIAVLTFNLDCSESGKIIKWNCTEVYRRNLDNQWKIIQTHWSLVKPQ